MLKISAAVFSSRAPSRSISSSSCVRQVVHMRSSRAPAVANSFSSSSSRALQSQRSHRPLSFQSNSTPAYYFSSSSATASSSTNSTSPIHEKITKDVKSHKVVLYMKGTPEQPMCGFSRDVVHMLNSAGADYVAYNVLESPELREGIKKFSNWPTIPQVFVAGEFIGGRDITWSLYQSGELRDLLLKNSALVPEAVEEAKKQQQEQSAAKKK